MKVQKYYREEAVLPVNHNDKPMTATEIMAASWVSVDEALPTTEDGDWVLGVASGKSRGSDLVNAITLVTYDADRCVWELEAFPFTRVRVSHWMRLPDLPTGVPELPGPLKEKEQDDEH